MKPEMRRQLLKLLSDSTGVLKAVEHLEPRRAVGTILFVAATIADSVDMPREDFLKGCESGWGAAVEMNETLKKEGTA